MFPSDQNRFLNQYKFFIEYFLVQDNSKCGVIHRISRCVNEASKQLQYSIQSAIYSTSLLQV